MAARWEWCEHEERELRLAYADTSTADLAERFGCSLKVLQNKAHLMGLKKSAAYLSAIGRRYLPKAGAGTRFQKGLVPHNKGKPHPSRGRSRETQFKRGNHPQTWRPIGTERVRDGYLVRKVTDLRNPPWRDWKPVHVVVWESHHGPVPPKHRVCFRDGDRSHIEISNLELVSFKEVMQRNTVHNLPPELVSVIQLRAGLVRTINRRSKQQ